MLNGKRKKTERELKFLAPIIGKRAGKVNTHKSYRRQEDQSKAASKLPNGFM